jgi:hypothetical protein
MRIEDGNNLLPNAHRRSSFSLIAIHTPHWHNHTPSAVDSILIPENKFLKLRGQMISNQRVFIKYLKGDDD